MMSMFFPFDVGGQKCIRCHRVLSVLDGPHSLNGEPGRPVDFACAECCPICASNAQQERMEATA